MCARRNRMSAWPSGVSVSRIIRVSVIAFFLGTICAASASSSSDGEPAMATAGRLEDHEATSVDPESLEAESHQMDIAETEDPEMLTVDASEARVVDSSLPAAHQGGSTALDELGTAAPDPGMEIIDDGRLARADSDNLTAEQLLAKRRLERAQSKAGEARARYGQMMERNYPRGAPRERIVAERDATMRVLEDARRQFDAAMGN
jgi:hypothetical protein